MGGQPRLKVGDDARNPLGGVKVEVAIARVVGERGDERFDAEGKAVQNGGHIQVVDEGGDAVGDRGLEPRGGGGEADGDDEDEAELDPDGVGEGEQRAGRGVKEEVQG